MTVTDFIQSIHDKGLFKRAKKIATPRRWRMLHTNGTYTWGECKSSATRWYKVVLELSPQRQQTYCNCPSRLKPCKHSLALSILLEQKSGEFTVAQQVPSWIDERLNAPPPSAQAAELTAQKNAKQRQLSRAKRIEQMKAGLNELAYWLTDLVRLGIANATAQNPSLWNDIAARMTNAKLSGISNRLQYLGRVSQSEHWHPALLQEIGDLYLLTKSFQRLDNLPPYLQQELLAVAGINIKKDELIEDDITSDTWLVCGQTEGTDDEKLFWKRTWLYGEQSQRFGLVLEFAFGQQPYEYRFDTGAVLRADVIYYPAALPMRVLPLDWKRIDEPIHWEGIRSWTTFADNYAEVIGKNPWQQRLPLLLMEVIPQLEHDNLVLIDKNKKYHYANVFNETVRWKLLALSGGHPIHVFGEWDGSKLWVLSTIANDRMVHFTAPPLPRPERANYWGN